MIRVLSGLTLTLVSSILSRVSSGNPATRTERPTMYYDRFDIAEAYYLWLADNHGGQWSPKYRRLSRMTRYYRPRLSLSLDTLSDNAREIYDNIRAVSSLRSEGK